MKDTIDAIDGVNTKSGAGFSCKNPSGIFVDNNEDERLYQEQLTELQTLIEDKDKDKERSLCFSSSQSRLTLHVAAKDFAEHAQEVSQQKI